MPIRKETFISIIVEILRNKSLALSLLFDDRNKDLDIPFSFLYPTDYIQALEKSKLVFNIRFKRDIFEIYKYLAQKLLKKYQNEIRVDCENLGLYHLYVNSLDTLPIVAFKFKEFSDLDRNKFTEIHITDYINQFNFFPAPILRNKIEEISDLHFHLGGALKFNYRLQSLYFTFKPNKIKKLPDELFVKHLGEDTDIESLIFLFFIVESLIVSRIAEINLKDLIYIEDLCNFYYEDKRYYEADNNYVFYRFLGCLKDGLNDKFYLYRVYSRLKSINIRNPHLSVSEAIITNLDNYDEIYKTLLSNAEIEFRKKNILLADFLMLLAFINYAECNENDKNLIQAYLILRNILKTVIIQQHRRADFSYFSSYSQSSLKNSKIYKEYSYIKKSLEEEFKNIKVNLEARVSMPETALQMDRTIEKILEKFDVIDRKKEMFSVENGKKKKYKKEKNFRLNIVFSLRKERDRLLSRFEESKSFSMFEDENSFLNSMEIIRWENTRKKLKKYIFELKIFLDFYRNSKFLSGIDVSSNENFTPPEVYSKLYRYFKLSHIIKSSHIKRNKNDRLLFTYHVGEDFDNLLTGIRRVYEAIIFLDLDKGDRLSHLFSIGVDPKIVLKSRDFYVNISKQDLLDNLVFAYFFIRNHLSKKLDFRPYLEELEQKAQSLLYEFIRSIDYDIDIDFTLEDYYQSWLLRRNCPYEFNLIIDNPFIRELLYSELENINESYPLKINLIQEFIRHFDKYRDIVESLYSDKVYLYASLPDLFNDKFKIENKENFFTYQYIFPKEKAFVLYYLYNSNLKWIEKGSEIVDYPITFDSKLIRSIQDRIIDILSEKDIVGEILITSNLLITPLMSISEHPILRFLGVKPKRKRRVKVVLGSDNPGIQETNILMEYTILFNLLNNHMDKKKSFDILNEIIENGNRLFEKRHI